MYIIAHMDSYHISVYTLHGIVNHNLKVQHRVWLSLGLWVFPRHDRFPRF